jgi:two-component system CheB/CheR fusion protein
VQEYLKYLDSTPAELNALFNDLLIEVTSFFRDSDAFLSLNEKIINRLLDIEEPEIRVWVPACATGQEAYSIAILLFEALEKSGSDKTFRIFATDISEEAINFSSSGIYHPDLFEGLDFKLRDKYFYPIDENRFRVHPKIRSRISFFKHNLLADPPFPYLDLICCRNLLIYFKPEFQQQVISIFHFALRGQGVLFLGSSENLASLAYGFEVLDHRWRIFARKPAVRLPFEAHRLKPEPVCFRSGEDNSVSSGDYNSRGQLIDVFDNLLEVCGQPGILLDASFEILHINGTVMSYFPMPKGRLTSKILDWADSELKIALSSGLEKAEYTKKPVRVFEIPVSNNSFAGIVELVVTPFENKRQWYYFIQISSSSDSHLPETPELKFNLEQEAKQRIENLETEVRELQNNLYCALEAKRSSQEELQASNEELRASNEELQSSNEELQAISAEHEEKIKELSALNNDMQNLLISTDIAVVFMDNQLHIRRYTPVAERLLGLGERDIGRQIGFVRSELIDAEALRIDVQKVLNEGIPVEFEIKTSNGQTYLHRLLPYRDEVGAILGIVLTFTDTTNLREAESAFLDSEIRFQAAVEAVNDVVWSYDVDADRFDFSDRWLKTVGQDCRSKSLNMAEFLVYLHADDRKSFQRDFATIYNDFKTFESEFRIYCGDTKSWKWLNSRGRIIAYDNEKKAVRILGTLADVTYRKQLESEQQQRQSMLALLCDGVGLGFWIYELESEKITIDKVFAAIVGLDQEVFPTEHFLRMCHPKDKQKLKVSIKNLFNGRSSTIIHEFRILRNEEPVWVRLSGIISERSEKKLACKAIGFIEDIDKRKRSEKALEESIAEVRRQKEIFEEMIDNMPLAVLGKKPDNNFRYFLCNPAAEKLFQMPKEKILGNDLSIILTPEDAKTFSDYDKEICESHEIFNVAERKLRLGEVEKEVKISKIPILNVNNQVDSIFVLIQDLTEERSLSRQLLHAQKMEAVGRLAGGIAHDFNNMLQTILGYGSLIAEEISENNDAHENLALVLKAADQASSLVRQLMTFSRKKDLHMQPDNLVKRVQDLTKMLNRLLGDHIKVDTSFSVEEIWALVDSVQIEQALINICLNAKDAMKEGGELKLVVSKQRIGKMSCEEFTEAEPGNYAVISVADTGKGIPFEQLEHIFEPFYTTKDMGKGTGLGLATVYAIIKQHGGFIQVFSGNQRGTEFKIFLPIAKKCDNSLKRPMHHDISASKGETVLLAEDQEMVRSFAARILKKAGYKVLEASDGLEAVDVFSKNCSQIDLLIFDVMMPNLNGKEAYEKICRIRKDVPVLFCSGYGDEILKSEYLVDIDSIFLAKPYKSSELLFEIKKLLSEKSIEDNSG